MTACCDNPDCANNRAMLELAANELGALATQLATALDSRDDWQKLANERSAEIIRLNGLLAETGGKDNAG